MPAAPQDQSYAIEVQIEVAITAAFIVFQTAVLIHAMLWTSNTVSVYLLHFL